MVTMTAKHVATSFLVRRSDHVEIGIYEFLQPQLILSPSSQTPYQGTLLFDEGREGGRRPFLDRHGIE